MTPAVPPDAAAEVACPRCGTTVRARLADAPPRSDETLALAQPPVGTHVGVDGEVVERDPDGWWYRGPYPGRLPMHGLGRGATGRRRGR